MYNFDRVNYGRDAVDINNVFEGTVLTDVEGLESDAIYRRGSDELPIFEVTKDDFINNMEIHRQRCRFKAPKVQEYLQKTRYKNPFFVKYTDEDTGKTFIRKVK